MTRAGVFLAAGLPLLVVGWLGSGLANQLSFAVWGLVAATVCAALLRRAWGAGWATARTAAVAFGWLAIGWGVFGALADSHDEILALARQAWPLGRGVVWGGATTFFVLAALAAVLAIGFSLRLMQRAQDESASSR